MAKKLLLKNNQQTIAELTREIPENGIISVGSDVSAALCLDDAQIAPEQFIIICEDGKMTLLNRAAGTVVNFVNLSPGALQELCLNDEISIGKFSLTPKKAEAADDELKFAAMPQNYKISPPETNKTDSITDSDVHITMNDVLENLRSDEKFYFQIEEKSGEKRRVYVDFEEMWLGWTKENLCVVSEKTEDIKFSRGRIRKDWSGVVLYPNQPETILVNDEILSAPHRLKNDDRLHLQSPDEDRVSNEFLIKFHEPTALLVLDSILSKELPPPVSLSFNGKTSGQKTNRTNAENAPQNSTVGKQKSVRINLKSDRIFGYFNVSEILIMTFGTLITAAIIFLFLEWF